MDIVLIPGLWLASDAWDPVVPSLADAGHHPIPVTLPTQAADGSPATLDDQLSAVLAAIEGAGTRVLVVGHSAAATLAWLAADRRPERVAAVVMVGGMPNAEGEPYFTALEPVDGQVSFPGWSPFEGPDADDLTPEMRVDMEARVRPVPESVVTSIVHYENPERVRVPVIMVCPEFSPDDVREWLAGGGLPELASVERVEYVDLDSGHWPMFSRPAVLAQTLTEIANADLLREAVDGRVGEDPDEGWRLPTV